MRIDSPQQNQTPQTLSEAKAAATETNPTPVENSEALNLAPANDNHTAQAQAASSELNYALEHAANDPQAAYPAASGTGLPADELSPMQVKILSASENNSEATLREGFEKVFKEQASNKEQFHKLMKQAYGDAYDYKAAESLRQRALNNDFSWLPKLVIVSDATLQGGKGAYDKNTGTIYLAASQLGNPQDALRTYIEEVGHHIDTLVNKSDARGDEGELFARLITGETLTQAQIDAIKNENDKGKIVINGMEVDVEFRSRKARRRARRRARRARRRRRRRRIFGKFKRAFKKIGKALKKVVKVIKKIVDIINIVLKPLLEILSKLPIVGNVINAVNMAVSALKAFVEIVQGDWKGFLKQAWEITKNAIGSFPGGEQIKNVIEIIETVVKSVIKIAKGDFMGAFGLLGTLPGVGKVSGALSETFGKVGQAISKVVTKVKSIVDKIKNLPGLRTMVKFFKTGISSILKARRGDWQGALFGLGDLPGMDQLGEDLKAEFGGGRFGQWFSGAKESVGSFLQNAKDKAQEIWGGISEGGRTFLKGLFEIFKPAVQNQHPMQEVVEEAGGVWN